MSSFAPPREEKSTFTIALLYMLALLITWSGAWLFAIWLREQNSWFGQPFGAFLYWLAMRMLLWVLPSLHIIRLSGRSVREVLGFNRVKAILLWGGITGLIWGGKTPLFALLGGQPVGPIVWDWSFVTAVVYAPLVEEITFRGALMGAFLTRMRFSAANLITGVLFLLIHFPSWYFEGVFRSDLLIPASYSVGILLLGWILGIVAHRAKSVAAATLTHMLNNFFQRYLA